jgi:hypothetical protein
MAAGAWSVFDHAVFRRANEELREYSAELLEERGEMGSTAVPFLCECGDRSCTRIVRLKLAEFDHVRGGNRRVVLLPGHEADQPVRVVSRREHFVVVEAARDAGPYRACA